MPKEKVLRRRKDAASEEDLSRGYIIYVKKRGEISHTANPTYLVQIQTITPQNQMLEKTKVHSMTLSDVQHAKFVKFLDRYVKNITASLIDDEKLKSKKVRSIKLLGNMLQAAIEDFKEQAKVFSCYISADPYAHKTKVSIRLRHDRRVEGASPQDIFFGSAPYVDYKASKAYKDAVKFKDSLSKKSYPKAKTVFQKKLIENIKFPGKWNLSFEGQNHFTLRLPDNSAKRVRALTAAPLTDNRHYIANSTCHSQRFIQLLSNVFVYHALSADDMAAIIAHQKTLYGQHKDRLHLMNVIETGLAKGVEFFESYYVNEKACEYWFGFLETTIKLMSRQTKKLCEKGLGYVPKTKDWAFIERVRSAYYFIENLPRLPLKGKVKKNYQDLMEKAQAARTAMELKFKKHVFISLSLDAELLKKPYDDRMAALFFSLKKAVEHAYQSAPLAQVHISAAEDFLHHAVTDLPGFETQIDAFLRKHPNVVLHLPVRSAENVVIDCLDEAYDDKLKALKAECESAREINREYENEGAVDEYLRDLEGTIKAADSGYYVTRQLMIRAFVQNDEVQVHKTPKKMMVFEGGNDFNPYREFDYIGFEADAVFSPAIEGESANWIEKGKQWFATAICLDEKQGVVEHTRPVLTEKEAADAIYIVPANGAKKGGHEVRLAGNYAYAVHIDQRHGAYFAAGNKVKAREAVCFDANVVSVGDVFSLTEKPFDLVAPSIEKGLPAEMVLPGIDGILAYFGLGRPVEKMADIDDESASDDDEYVGDSSDEEGEVLAEPVSPLAGAGAGSGEGAYVFAKTSLDKAKPSPRPAKKVKISQKGVDPAAA